MASQPLKLGTHGVLILRCLSNPFFSYTPLNIAERCFIKQVVRTRLMPGILKTAGSNKDHPKPIKV